MHLRNLTRVVLCSAALSLFAAHAFAQATQTPAKQFEPQVGQAGKDVVWVPTPQALVDKMLDMAKVTPQDFVMDLGSGDGRTVITAAKRGARAQGVEYNPDMVTLAKKNAAAAGVSDKATFVQADLFATDFSKAQVITMFLLPSINIKLRPTILNMRPGTRVVSNSFTMEDWQADQVETIHGVHELVHGPPVDRAGKGRGDVADAAGRADAAADLPECDRNAGEHADLRRETAWRGDHLQGRAPPSTPAACRATASKAR